MTTRGVRTNWALVAKIKIERAKNDAQDESLKININEDNLANVLRAKEYEFNNTIAYNTDDIIDHPTMISKYLKKFFKWEKKKKEKEN